MVEKLPVRIPFNKPTLPAFEHFSEAIKGAYNTGQITNSTLVRQFEQNAQDCLKINNIVAVSSCTNGLILSLNCLGVSGKVALPSFTFFASAHSIIWNGLEPVFVDIDKDTWNISTKALMRALEEEDIEAVLPVHIFGNPCDVEALSELKKQNELEVVFDAAHSMGAKVHDAWIGGYGRAEVFSLSPTKLVVAGEGGLICTRDQELAEKLRAARDYGNIGDYNPEIIGLNARMSEFHAALGIDSLKMLEQNVARRNEIAKRYTDNLEKLPGIEFQMIKQGNLSTYKDFTILISEEAYGLNRDVLSRHLKGEGIDNRIYYYPPVHRTKAYWEKWGKYYDERLPVTNHLSKNVLSLPMWSHMEMEIVDEVCEKIVEAHDNCERIASKYVKEMR